MQWVYVVAGVLGGLIAGFIIQFALTKIKGEKIAAAAGRLKAEAEREADQLLREARVTAKSDALKIKEEVESELKDRRREVQTLEKRLAQKEENLERKSDSLDAKLKNAEKKERDLDAQKERFNQKEEELKKTIARQVDELERISMLDRESAKNMILEKLKGEVENECGILIRDILEETRQKAERESQKLLIYAIQRYAGDCTYERTTATIPLPSDEMNGSRHGRQHSH